MIRLRLALARVPRTALFAVAGLIQVAVIAAMVIDRAGILRQGTEITLDTRPVDPRDLLRGDYVQLRYQISNLRLGALAGTPSAGKHTPIFVTLAPNPEGFYAAVSAHLQPVPLADREVLIRGRVTSGFNCGGDVSTFCPTADVAYGIERYFVPEGEGRAIESARNQGKVSVVAAVTSDGRAAIKRLLIDGKAVYDEPLF
jgi:GDYXXLXY protein